MTLPDDGQNPSVSEPVETEQRPLPAAAQRALAEAAERRAAAARAQHRMPPEVGGSAGPEPTRYGDWEKGGIASDF
ncbi:MAG: DUF1674 domain-containing protein [Rhizobiales bacterium]|nr:DUF1674 domain-containing protein [Hyphomicrobiales bacterium]